MLERDYQSKLIKTIKRLYPDSMQIKIESSNTNGMPDLMLIFNQKIIFLECKKKNGRLSEIQKFQHKKLKKLNIPCLTVSDIDTAITFINQTLKLH